MRSMMPVVFVMPPMEVTSKGRTLSLVMNGNTNLWSALEMSQSDRGAVNREDFSVIKPHHWILQRWYRTPRQCAEAVFGENADMCMSRTSINIMEYWDNPYLSVLSDADFSERFHDLTQIVTVLSPGNIYSMLPVINNEDDVRFAPIWLKYANAQEECRRRYGLSHLGETKYHIPVSAPSELNDQQQVFARRMLEVLDQSPGAIIRFGHDSWVKDGFLKGIVRFAPASTMRQQEDDARKDNEMSFELVDHLNGAKQLVECEDYWMWCATKTPDKAEFATRLFSDFGANCCVVIKRAQEFIADLERDCMRKFPRTKIGNDLVRYADPFSCVDPFGKVTSKELPFVKHFRFTYQNELRVVCLPKPSRDQLRYICAYVRPLHHYDAVYVGK